MTHLLCALLDPYAITAIWGPEAPDPPRPRAPICWIVGAQPQCPHVLVLVSCSIDVVPVAAEGQPAARRSCYFALKPRSHNAIRRCPQMHRFLLVTLSPPHSSLPLLRPARALPHVFPRTSPWGRREAQMRRRPQRHRKCESVTGGCPAGPTPVKPSHGQAHELHVRPRVGGSSWRVLWRKDHPIVGAMRGMSITSGALTMSSWAATRVRDAARAGL